MLKHHFAEPTFSGRAVVLGAGGFVGSSTVRKLTAAGMEVLPLTRQELDLETPQAADTLAGMLRPDDALIFISAKAPVKNVSMLLPNIRMAEAVCGAIEKSPVAHVVYVSSDAVYADSPDPLSETSVAEPGALHGVMHLTRELALRHICDAPLAILRPTLIYGADDPHNGYGPNSFRRLAAAGKDITLFGEGEERRDHVCVEDVADLLCRMVSHRSEGVLNAATGVVTSFREIAEHVVALAPQTVSIKTTPRSGPMPHDGYRPFDPTATRTAFADFHYTPLSDGLAIAVK